MQIFGSEVAARAFVEQSLELSPARYDGRNQNIRLSVSSRLQVSDDREQPGAETGRLLLSKSSIEYFLI